MNVIIQQEETGCGIASVANIVGLSYAKMVYRDIRELSDELSVMNYQR